MLKKSSSLYKMPFFNVEHQSLKSVAREKDDFQEVACVCIEDSECDLIQSGYKYNFKYNAKPIIEPTSYRLKGQSWDASLGYNDLGVDAESEIMKEVQQKLDIIGNGVSSEIMKHKQNHFENWQLSNKVFQKMNNIIYKEEVYNTENYEPKFVPSVNITSEIYLVNISWSVVHWVNGDPRFDRAGQDSLLYSTIT